MFTWLAVQARSWPLHHAGLLLAGLCVGFSVLTKLPGLAYLGVVYAWCWIAPAIDGRNRSAFSPPAPTSGRFQWLGAFATLAAGVASFWLLKNFEIWRIEMDPVGTARLRTGAIAAFALHLATPWQGRNPIWNFMQMRGRELAIILGGIQLSFLASYLLLRLLMTKRSTFHYLYAVLKPVLNPSDTITAYASNPKSTAQFMVFLQHDSWLIASTVILIGATAVISDASLKFKSFLGLLVVSALGMALVLSRRYFSLQYALFVQVPLIVAITLATPALLSRWTKSWKPSATRWLAPILACIALGLAYPPHARLHREYSKYQGFTEIDNQVLFLYDHGFHSPQYKQAIRDRYGDEREFRQHLIEFLSVPGNHH